MKKIPALLSFFTLLFCSGYSLAQADKINRDQADFFYRHYAFAAAIDYYELLSDKTVNDKIRLADCYRLTNSPSKAALYYRQSLASNEDTTSINRLHYAQVLMTLEKYEDAQKWLELYSKEYPSERRAQNLISGCQTARKRKIANPGGYATFLSEFNTNKNEYAPTIWKGKLVFSSDSAYEVNKKTDVWTGNAFFNIYTASFDSNRQIYGGEISAAIRSGKGNTKYHDGPCTFASDINEMYFTRTRCNRWTKGVKQDKDSVALLNIMIAGNYDTTERKFKKIKPFAFNSKSYSTAHPAVSPDGRLLIFASNKKGGAGGFDLYMCKRQADGKWLSPENMGNHINTEGDELFPYLADSKTLYFSSDGQKDCFGGLDVYKSTFNGTGWSAPENSGTPVNSSYDDISLALHEDGSSSFFSSNRPAKKAGDNVYYFRSKQLFLLVDVKDANTKMPLSEAVVTLSESIDTFTVNSNSAGQCFNSLFPKYPYKYKVVVALDSYITATNSAVFYGKNKLSDTIQLSVSLERAQKIYEKERLTPTVNENSGRAQVSDGNGNRRDQKIFFNLKVMDCRTRKPVNDTAVKVNVTFDTSVKRISYYLDAEVEDGEITRELFPGKKYMLEISSFDYKALYLTKINTDFLTNFHADTVITDSVCLDAREDVIDLGLIPFDFDSTNLNNLAQKRLAKFVKYLKEIHPNMKLLIRGHTDCRETKPGHNKILSEKRANAVMDYLISNGVWANRLRAVGVKDDMPRVRCNNCEHDNSAEKLIKKRYLGGRVDCGANEHAENRYIDCVILNY